VLTSLNVAIAFGKQTLGIVKSGTGKGCIVIDFVITELLQPSAVVTVKVTLYVPTILNIWVNGAGEVLVIREPSPKFHVHKVMGLVVVVDESEKVILPFTQFGDENPKLATGGASMVIV
jgi:hypothetical protein